MNLKEAFRYQNFLDRLLNQTMATLSIQDNLLEVSKLHRRGKAIAGGEDETEVAEVPELVAPDAAISLALSIVKEKEALTKAIGVSKGNLAGGVGDMDAAIEANKCRQSVAEKIRSVLRIKSGKRVERGTGYTFNGEGNQVPYIYDVEVTTIERFDRAKLKATMQDLLSEADKVSAQIDEAVVNTKVDYTAPWDVNASFEDILSTFQGKDE